MLDIYDNLVNLFAEKITIYKQHLLYDYTCTMVRSLVYTYHTNSVRTIQINRIMKIF